MVIWILLFILVCIHVYLNVELTLAALAPADPFPPDAPFGP
jgi:hypothetical protein